MENIAVHPGDLWDFFNNECLDDDSDHLIAENEDFGVEIYVCNEDGLPVINVFCDCYLINSEFVKNEQDCLETASRLYKMYLTPAAFDTDIAVDNDFETEAQLAQQEDREEELDWAFTDLLASVAPEYNPSDDERDEIKEKVLEVLAREFDVPVYRPMFLTDENGADFFEEYPYEVMIFEDEVESK